MTVDRGTAITESLAAGNVPVAGLHTNGWQVRALHVAETKPGEVPHGVVCFEREVAPFEGKKWGTALWDTERGISFFSGHYDLAPAEAYKDFARRMAEEVAR